MVKLPNQFDRIPPRFHQNSEELLILDAEKDEENTKAMGEEVVSSHLTYDLVGQSGAE